MCVLNENEDDNKQYAANPVLNNSFQYSQQQIEKALKSQKERLALAIEGAGDGIWDWDIDKKTLYFSPHLKIVLGYEDEEFAGHFEAWQQRIHDDDFIQMRTDLDAHLQNKTPMFSNLHRIQHKQGHYFWFLVRGRAVRDETGHAYRIVGTYINVNEYKHMENALLVLIQNTALDLDNFLQQSLQTLVQAYVVNHAFVGIFTDDTNSQVYTLAAWQEGQFVENFNYEITNSPAAKIGTAQTILVGKGSRDIYFNDSLLQKYSIESFFATPLISPHSGQHVGILVIMDEQPLEITAWIYPLLSLYALQIMAALERDRHLKTLQNYKNKIETAHHSTLKLLNNINQDLPQTLDGLAGAVSSLADSYLDEKQRSYLSVIDNAVHLLSNMAKEINGFSHLESNKLNLQSDKFNLLELLNDIMMPFDQHINEKNIDLICYMSPQVPTAFYGDMRYLHQILTNILSNAVKFTHRGEVIIRVSLLKAHSKNGLVRFEIQDTGVGIDKEQQALLFQPLSDEKTQIDTDIRQTNLFVTQQLVEKIGGTIGLNSQLKKGSIFWCDIPLKQVEEKEASDNPLKGKQLLLVEENMSQRLAIQQQAQTWGMRVSLFEGDWYDTDKLKKLIIAEDLHIDIALVNYRLDYMDGISFIQNCRQTPQLPHFPIILITKSIDQLSDQILNDLNIIDQFVKPVTFKRLYDTLVAVLDKQSKIVDKSLKQLHTDHTVSTNKISTQHDNVLPKAKKIGNTTTKTTKMTHVENTTTFNGVHVLVVEDSPLNRDVLCDMLKRLDCTIDAVENGQEALDILEHNTYDLIFMDCDMPILDGYEATKRIRINEKEHNSRHIPIVALTAHLIQSQEIGDPAMSMDEYANKPIRLNTLRDILNRWVKLKKTETKLELPKEKESNTTVSTEQLPEQPIDYKIIKHLDEIMGCDMRKLLVQQYLDAAPERLTILQTYLQQKAEDQLYRQAHQLKGESLQIGAVYLGNLCKELEDVTKKGAFDQANYYIIQIEQEFTRLNKLLIEIPCWTESDNG